MEVQIELSARRFSTASASSSCPRCRETAGGMPSVETSTLEQIGWRRCTRCGTRFSDFRQPPLMLFTCSVCGLPFSNEELLPHNRHRCESCSDGRLPVELPGEKLAEAMEKEARAGLSGRWDFVTSASLAEYLQRITTQLAARMEGAPPDCRVVLTDDSSIRTLAMPSGLIILSRGTLEFLEDEAELVFVLAHELAHAASADAVIRLIRLGLHAATEERSDFPGESWADAALDLVRLGYGRHRERDADLRAINLLVELDYDSESVIRYLKRLQSGIRRGDPTMSELALAHPTPSDRIRHLEKSRFRKASGPAGGKVNREVYRRAAGGEVLRNDLVPDRLDSLLRPETADRPAPASDRSISPLAWIGLGAAGLAILAAIILLAGILLSG